MERKRNRAWTWLNVPKTFLQCFGVMFIYIWRSICVWQQGYSHWFSALCPLLSVDTDPGLSAKSGDSASSVPCPPHCAVCTPPLSCTPHCAHQPCPAHHHSAHHHLLSPKEHNTTKTLVRVLDLHWVSFAPCGLSPCSQTPFGDRILGEAANTIFRGFPFTDLHQQLSPLQELLPLPLCLPPLLLLESLPVLWNWWQAAHSRSWSSSRCTSCTWSWRGRAGSHPVPSCFQESQIWLVGT